MQKSKKVYIAILGAVMGVALLLFGGRLTGDGGGEDASGQTLSQGTQTMTMEAYREDLEQRMEAICEQVRGAGKVSVVVSLSGGFEYVYASDTKWTSNSTATEYILVDSGSTETPVLLYQKAPEIVGIGVVCTGGDDPDVRGAVMQLLSAAFGVGSHKIHVTGGGT